MRNGRRHAMRWFIRPAEQSPDSNENNHPNNANAVSTFERFGMPRKPVSYRKYFQLNTYLVNYDNVN